MSGSMARLMHRGTKCRTLLLYASPHPATGEGSRWPLWVVLWQH